MTQLITTRDLARDTGFDQEAIRAYLRELYGSKRGGRWQLDESQAHQVREHFAYLSHGTDPGF